MTIIKTIKRIVSNFLCGGGKASSASHLVSWDKISRPYHYGGWNVKNLDWFNVSLRMKSLWMALTGKGLWNKSLQTKYLRKLPLQDWLWKETRSMNNTSINWNSFTYVLGWVCKAIT